MRILTGGLELGPTGIGRWTKKRGFIIEDRGKRKQGGPNKKSGCGGTQKRGDSSKKNAV